MEEKDLDMQKILQIKERLEKNTKTKKETAEYYNFYKEDVKWLIDKIIENI